MTVFPERPLEGVHKDLIREDEVKLQCILQFLHSRGLERTAAQLETESEIAYKPDFLKEGSVIDSALDRYWSQSNSESDFTPQESRSVLPLPGTCVTEVIDSFENIHGSANPTCVCWHPEDTDLVVTGGADRRVIVRNISTGNTVLEREVASPVLALDWTNPEYIVIACMGGEVYTLQLDESRHMHFVAKPHGTARILAVSTSPDKQIVATMAKHSCVHFFSLPGTDVPNPKPLRFERDVTAICWIEADTLVVAETENPILTVWGLRDSNWTRVGELCMNLSVYDPRTPYTTLVMSWNAEHRLLASATNRNSVLLTHLPSDLSLLGEDVICPCKTLYGMSIGVFDTPSIAFSFDGSHLYVTSDKSVLVFEIRSGHAVISIPVSESKAIRHMQRHPSVDMVATVSFDRKLSILG